MANSKISALTAATTPLAGTETLPIVQGGVTVKTTVADITNGGGYAGSFTTLSATGVTTVQAGTALLPAITTSGDTNTGIWFPAADTIAFTGGGAESMRITSAGNVGIGVTPSAWLSTTKVLQIGDRASIFTNSSEQTLVGNNVYVNSSSQNTYIETALASLYQQAAGVHYWYNAPSGTAGNAITFTQAMTLDASGNLGIGTTAPSSKLQVSNSTNGGSVDITVANTYYLATSIDESVSFQGEFYQDNVAANRAAGYMRFTKVGDFSNNANASANIIFATRNAGTLAEKFRIDNAGNVLVTSSGGLGYGTGSGGTVTQATSRTTGVTLNKTNGAITLVSAAGLATFQSFTVTNSTVAATDVVRVTQKSGTDLYQIFVTATAAGSFKITFATTGGVTVEQPVFNFAIIKGVTA